MRLLVRLLIAMLVIAAAGYWLAARSGAIPEPFNAFSPLDPRVAPNMLTGFKLWRTEDDFPACIAALQRSSATFRQAPVHTESFRPGCELSDTVIVSKLSRASIAAEEMRCDIALRLYMHERHDIQPLARAYFGAGVTRIHHFGSYSCRNIRGGRRISQHATANAFDIAGYRLDNGTDVTLKTGWTAGGARSQFLRDIRVRACLLFNTVLSPDYNADHADHFHVDMGGYMTCR